MHGDRADFRYDLLGPVAVAGVAARACPTPADLSGLGGQMLVHLGLQRGLHQVLGQLGQDPALAHQPQPALGGPLHRERGQLLQQLSGQSVHGYRHRLHVGTLGALTSLGKRHAPSRLDQVTSTRTHQVTPSWRVHT
ncbi:hypothetical protein OG830_36420 [Streptomyces sp. NBC_00121]|nr:hypothetical protein [Streptomyces sp. NBC_01760]WSC73639.1 hypothetical protein OG807_37090 [Streptomyces sp. NBC_01760]